MLRELNVVEQRYRAVLEVLSGIPGVEVDAGAVLPPFTGSGVLRAMANATSLVDALAGASTVDGGLRRWGDKRPVSASSFTHYCGVTNPAGTGYALYGCGNPTTGLCGLLPQVQG